MEQIVALQALFPAVDIEEAAALVKKANRILVMGCSGGGKSTLSRKIAAHVGLAYVSIDRDVLWLPGWVQRDKAEQRAIIVAKVQGERWIMDGTNPSTFDVRLPRTDLVIWVRMPRLLCIWGAVSRWIKWMGRTRPEMAPGCIEKIDWEFLRFIWTFEEKFTPRVLAGLAEHGPDVPVLQLKSRGEMRQLLDLLGRPA
ncbi:topology modulation protein [Rhizobium tropici CIAT 899]|uniref:AAA family ATPase n=1 Tax=Rhizobium tropici TaxID=398 RepID=A0A6P1CAJ2_RHITR|nr:MULTISPECIES: topology modulation protein [Rhizobium]AGB71116.1 topology modulation protein [Rhizobium tropici CIAT 899]MBB4244708.1 adenylate kinase family enzyme [Rhizobium tropici]MBB5596095.1 adenylate kinase family enzyme [Rhizobium tropici]MBB6495048.1 adenylate kinase family enzyme [Rhizobium tropici]NEV14150.1 AAA family ATPase [Rhizobium tropici]